MNADPTITLLDKKLHDRADFNCGVAALNTYLQQQASQDMEKHAAVAYVAVIEPRMIAGYYTLSQYSIELKGLPEFEKVKLASYPIVSATLLGRLAVATKWQGQKLGEIILLDALRRSLEQSKHIASAGLVVDAKDESAAAFYRKYDFKAILDADHRLFLPMNKIKQMF
jgi:predicted GNAT family N-acyltransferase